MVHSSKTINRNFLIKASGINSEGKRINTLVGVSGLLALIGEELADKFVTRKTLPEFYKTLGCKETPHPQYITNRDSTGYNRMVNNYDFVIQRLGLDADKVLAAVRKNLYNEVYSDQQTGLRQGLIDGGIKRTDGSKVKISELNKILKYCKDTGQGTLENWLKSNGFIAKGK